MLVPLRSQGWRVRQSLFKPSRAHEEATGTLLLACEAARAA
jgi:hypothetical protein